MYLQILQKHCKSYVYFLQVWFCERFLVQRMSLGSRWHGLRSYTNVSKYTLHTIKTFCTGKIKMLQKYLCSVFYNVSYHFYFYNIQDEFGDDEEGNPIVDDYPYEPIGTSQKMKNVFTITKNVINKLFVCILFVLYMFYSTICIFYNFVLCVSGLDRPRMKILMSRLLPENLDDDEFNAK